MKLDPQSVLEEAERFHFPRLHDTEGETRTGDLFAEALEREGWQVERTERLGSRISFLPNLGGIGVWLAISCFVFWLLLRYTMGRPWRWLQPMAVVGVVAILVCAIILYVRPKRRITFVRGALGPPSMIVARHSNGAESPSRVVLITHLYCIGKHPWVLYAVLLAFCCVTIITVRDYKQNQTPSLPLLWASALSLLLIPLSAIPLLVTGGKPMSGYNQTGIALLVGLARTLPKALRGRLELHVVGLGSARYTSFERMRRAWPTKPTLFLYLDCPGMSPKIDLQCSRHGFELTREAARDLWLPHRCRANRASHREDPNEAIVWLCGSYRAKLIDPKALMGTAQLVEELALRWAKIHQGDRSTAKSSQNPG